ncbi:Uncharacterized protein At2g33490 [Linum grandiflorum]
MYYFGNGNPATSDGLLMVDYLASAFNLPSPNSDFRQQKTCDYDVSTAMDNTFFLLNGMPQAQIIRYRSLHSQFDSFSDSLDSLCSSPQDKQLGRLVISSPPAEEQVATHSRSLKTDQILQYLETWKLGKVLLMLGKVQFELQKLVDVYRSHVFKTITVPSDSLLNELQTVEEMKEQCDEKRFILKSF